MTRVAVVVYLNLIECQVLHSPLPVLSERPRSATTAACYLKYKFSKIFPFANVLSVSDEMKCAGRTDTAEAYRTLYKDGFHIALSFSSLLSPQAIYTAIEPRFTSATMSVASDAVLTQILAQLQTLQVSQQTLQAKVSLSHSYSCVPCNLASWIS